MNRTSELPKPKANQSRSGCEKCKARKLKCGEEKPSCRRCVVGNWECVYIAPKVWLFEPSFKPVNDKSTGLVTSEELCRIPHGHAKQFRCQNSFCQSRPRDKKSAAHNFCRGPLCYGRLVGPVKVDKAGEIALRYWTNVFAPFYTLIVTIKDGSNGLLTRVLPWALREDLILDTVMATSLAYASQGDLSTENGSGALRFRNSVISKIMQRLPHGCDLTIVQAVICLIFTDMRLGFFDHCRAHLQGLRAMVASCGGLQLLGCDGMQRDIILVLDEVFHIFRDGDDPEFCSPCPRPPLLTRFGSFAPEIAAQKLGVLSVTPLFQGVRQETLFPWIHNPVVVWEDTATPAARLVEEMACTSAVCSLDDQQELVDITEMMQGDPTTLLDGAFGQQ